MKTLLIALLLTTSNFSQAKTMNSKIDCDYDKAFEIAARKAVKYMGEVSNVKIGGYHTGQASGHFINNVYNIVVTFDSNKTVGGRRFEMEMGAGLLIDDKSCEVLDFWSSSLAPVEVSLK